MYGEELRVAGKKTPGSIILLRAMRGKGLSLVTCAVDVLSLRLCSGTEEPELLVQAHAILLGPLLHDFPLGHPIERHPRERDALPRRDS
jgi:hypothetical protein